MVQVAVQSEKLPGCQPVMESKVLWQESHSFARAMVTKGGTKHLSSTSCRIDQSQQHFYRGGLTSTIRPQESKHLASFNLKSQVSYGNLIAKFFL